ncbi:MAG: hypothetical protein ABR577_11400 [Pyrinomonadaceae bacterium]
MIYVAIIMANGSAIKGARLACLSQAVSRAVKSKTFSRPVFKEDALPIKKVPAARLPFVETIFRGMTVGDERERRIKFRGRWFQKFQRFDD